jgi:hypothetical protein
MGAIPWIVIQLILVAVVIFVPQTVTIFLDKAKTLDLDKAIESIQQMDRSEGQTIKGDPMQGLGGKVDAPATPGAGAASSPAAEEDPMEAVRRALEQEKAKK